MAVINQGVIVVAENGSMIFEQVNAKNSFSVIYIRKIHKGQNY